MKTQRTPRAGRSELRDGMFSRSPGVSQSTLTIGIVVVVVLVGVLFLRESAPFSGIEASQSPGGTEAAGTSPSSDALATRTVPEASPTQAPTAKPEATLPGDVPGPDATVPPGVVVIRGLRIEALASLWLSLGMSCESLPGSFIGATGGYTLECIQTDAGANIQSYAKAVYWTSDGVQDVRILITSINLDAIDGAPQANQLIVPSVELAVSAAARAWIQDRIGSATCRSGCIDMRDGSEVTLDVGARGTHVLHIIAR